MDAVTYPDQKVIDFVQRHVIPLRVAFNDEKLAPQFNVKWTPTLITVDSQGVEHHRTLGFLPPEDFMASQLLGVGKTYFDLENFDEALTRFNMLLDSFPKNVFVPEALFYRGVALYKSTHDPKHLRHAYDKLTAEYPDNEWTRRAHPYSLIAA